MCLAPIEVGSPVWCLAWGWQGGSGVVIVYDAHRRVAARTARHAIITGTRGWQSGVFHSVWPVGGDAG
jgi:hypothetical protein